MQSYSDWILIGGGIVYFLVLLRVTFRIIMDTEDTSKALAYLIVVYMAPLVGIIIYYSVGVNYRKHPLYRKKITTYVSDDKEIGVFFDYNTEYVFSNHPTLSESGIMSAVKAIEKEDLSVLTGGNEIQLLVNGENTFPTMIEMINSAKKYVHILYYMISDDDIGKKITSALVQKAKEGVKIRILYDDFGTDALPKTMHTEMKKVGIEIEAFYKLSRWSWLTRFNNRNHRKILVVDGKEGMLGGINIGNEYDNRFTTDKITYRRDSHLRIHGPAVGHLQRAFICDWNFAAENKIEIDGSLFPEFEQSKTKKNDTIMQIVHSGPDSKFPHILYAYLALIHAAKKEIYLTTPYFAPDKTFLTALILASHRGVDVRILLPKKGDSTVLDSINHSYIENLLNAGIKIYFYEKGFIHAKTCVIDGFVCVIGTANLDKRSFELNFETNAILYDKKLGTEMVELYFKDLDNSELMTLDKWNNRSLFRKFADRFLRLLEPLL